MHPTKDKKINERKGKTSDNLASWGTNKLGRKIMCYENIAQREKTHIKMNGQHREHSSVGKVYKEVAI